MRYSAALSATPVWFQPPRCAAGFQRLVDKAPAAFFEKNIPGVRTYGLPARFGCLGVKFLEYSLGGMFCGLVGQSIANAAMMASRAHDPDADYTVDPPPILKTALVWGLFMGVSSNLRYQAVFGLERLVDVTIAKRIPQVRSPPITAQVALPGSPWP